MGVAFDRVVVVGLGMVGELLARLLHRGGHGVAGADRSRRAGLPSTTGRVLQTPAIAA